VRVTGIPTPVVKFYRDGAEIQSSLDFQISQEGDLYSLLIAEAYPEDSGTYSVNATNSVGRATSTAELVVQGMWWRQGGGGPRVGTCRVEVLPGSPYGSPGGARLS
jgi:hypothetical protein